MRARTDDGHVTRVRFRVVAAIVAGGGVALALSGGGSASSAGDETTVGARVREIVVLSGVTSDAPEVRTNSPTGYTLTTRRRRDAVSYVASVR